MKTGVHLWDQQDDSTRAFAKGIFAITIFVESSLQTTKEFYIGCLVYRLTMKMTIRRVQFGDLLINL